MANYDDLWTSVQARYSTTFLRGLTNPQDGATTSVTSAKGTAAAQDVCGDFSARGITYDDADPRHVAVAVSGVIAKLQERTGQHEWAFKRVEDYLKNLESLRMVTANDRMSPLTNSVLDPEEETSGEKPDMDPSRFGSIYPGSP